MPSSGDDPQVLRWLSGTTRYSQPRLIAIALISAFSSLSINAHATDRDHDGVPDTADRCPDSAQLRKLPADFKFAPAVDPARLSQQPQAHPVDRYGCEIDSDGDGVVDSSDYCPQDSKQALAMGVAANGCPRHSDADGTPDYRDRCPATPAGTRTDRYGCELKPDRGRGNNPG